VRGASPDFEERSIQLGYALLARMQLVVPTASSESDN